MKILLLLPGNIVWNW